MSYGVEEWWADQEPVTTTPAEKTALRDFLGLHRPAEDVVAAREFYASVHRAGPLPPRPLAEIAFMAGVAWERARAKEPDDAP
jgi:hypothetical protein